MVGETRDGEAVRAWIWQPQHELAYVAERGAGAWRNGERLRPAGTARRPGAWRGGHLAAGAGSAAQLPGLRPLELTWVCCGVDYPKLVEGAADFILYGRAQPVGPRPRRRSC